MVRQRLLTVWLTSCRSIPPTQQLDASQEDIFREVIPDGSAKALSRYTDMVDALIREQNDRLAGASDDARLRLRERDLPDCLQVTADTSSVAHPRTLQSIRKLVTALV